MKKVLITGLSGFLGWNVARAIRSRYRVFGTYLDHQVNLPDVETMAFDLSDLAKIPKLVETISPDFIVHTAAFSNPDFCETHHKEALVLNTFATRELAKVASRVNCHLIYISTDFVFDGHKGDYSEADTPAPINYYGRVKLLGELEITNYWSQYVTLRIGTLYGRGHEFRRNFYEKLETDLVRGLSHDCIFDQYRTFLLVDDAVDAILRFIENRQTKGLFHLGGPERVSRFDFAAKFCSVAGLSTNLLRKVRLADANLAAVRPADCSLNSDKIKRTLDLTPTPLEPAFRKLWVESPSRAGKAD